MVSLKSLEANAEIVQYPKFNSNHMLPHLSSSLFPNYNTLAADSVVKL
jgi:hypothetical protein